MKKEKKSNKVFISYVKDNKDLIDRISYIFRQNNIDYWLDREDIQPGKDWKIAIRNAIKEGAYFLACFSKEYYDRTSTYMNEEINLAIEMLRKKYPDSGWFIPIKLTECEIPSFDIASGKTLEDIQYLELYPDWPEGIRRLIDVIKKEEEPQKYDLSENFFEKEYLYLGLKYLIESADGHGFHNADLGHPVYVLGSTGKVDPSFDYADLPEKNLLFKMISKLSKELKILGIEKMRLIYWYDFSEWKDFCRFAVNAYRKKRGQTSSY